MKNLKKIVFGLLAMLVMVTSVSASKTACSNKSAIAKIDDVCYSDITSALDAADGKTVSLLKDITVSETLSIGEKAVTIDLNGHGIMNFSNVYTFDNEGELSIVGNDKSSILCTSQSVSCIRNRGTLNVENVSIQSNFVGLKNESGKMTIKDSSITTSHKSVVKNVDGKNVVESGLGIQNYGELVVENSTIKGNLGASAISNNARATAKVTNSTLEAQAVKVDGNASLVGSTVLNTNESPVEIADSTLKGTIEGNVATTGEITTIMENLQHMSKDTRVILAEDTVIKTGTLATSSIVPEGITLVVPKDVKLSVEGQGSLTVNGTLEGKVDAGVYNETKNVYYGLLEIALAPVNVNDGDKLDVLKNIEENEFITDAAKKAHAIVSNKDVTLNLNGHKVTTDLVNNEEGNLVIVDEAGRAEFDGEITNNGILTIESGYFTNVPENGENATTNLNGGTFPANQMNEELLPEGKELSKNADGTITVVDSKTDEPTTPDQPINPEGDGDKTGSKIEVEANKGDKEVTLSEGADEILKGSLTATEDEELKALLDKDVTIELSANKVAKESLVKEELAKFESAIEGANIVDFFDLSILVKADGEAIHYLRVLSKPITITIDLPELPAIENGYTRKYYILREHDGKVEQLDATLTDGKLSFATDKFSTYALAYADVKTTEVSNPTDEENKENPSTLDSIVSIVTLAISSLGTAGYSIKKFIRK